MDTKQKIFNAALELFSDNGYTASSIRDICKVVGIKESTVYYYYENKQAILDAMRDKFVESVSGLTKNLQEAMFGINTVFRPAVFAVGDCLLEKLFFDDFNIKFIRILTLEQGCNEELRKLYHEWVFEMPIRVCSQLLEQLTDKGFLQDLDSSYLAICYYSPIFFCYQRSFASSEVTDQTKEIFKRLVHSHLEYFLEQYEIKK